MLKRIRPESGSPAFLAQEPIIYGGITYLHISGLIYRLQGGKTVLKLELEDKCLHSVTIADPERVTRAGKEVET